jgi:hypothetical protein
MPGQRHTPGSRSRGSSLSRLAGLGAIVLIAGGGAAIYGVTFHPAAHHHTAPLPTKVAGSQTVGLIAQSTLSAHPGGRSADQLVQMLGPRGAPAFTPLAAAAANAQGSPQWNADLMVGGTYMFIFLPDQDCLAAARRSALVLAHCDTSARQQRWRRVNAELVKDGHDFYQYANLGDGRCLSQLTALAGQQVGAGLADCDSAQPASQMIAFWWLTV